MKLINPLPLFPVISLLLPATLLAEPPPLLQSKIKGLLVIELPNGKTAGTASQMNATAIYDEASEIEISFNQEVGESMNIAMKEVVKFIQVRHHAKLPEDYRVELAFADKYSSKDGPSAAVASALLIDSIFSGNELADDFAVTGDMNADGAVQPVGGVAAKIRGAHKKGCKVVAIPKKNEVAVSDSYVSSGISDLLQIQVFSIDTFEEAFAVSSKKRDEKITLAIEEFTRIQEVLAKNDKLISHPKVIEKLRLVSQNAPNHLSAKYLLLHATKSGPKSLSLVGSLIAIDDADTAFGSMLKDRSFLEQSGNNDVLFKFETELSRLRPLLDKRTVEYCTTYMELATYIKGIRSKRIFTQQMERELEAAIDKVTSARKTLLGDEEIQEELMLLE